MKVETAITNEDDLLKQGEVAAKDFPSSSEVFENALLQYLPQLKRNPKKRKLIAKEEIALMNRYADEYKKKFLENLEYQIDLWDETNFIEGD